MYLVVRILLSIPPANDYYRQQTVGDISVYLFTPSLPLSPHQANATPPRPFNPVLLMSVCRCHVASITSLSWSLTHSQTHTLTYAFLSSPVLALTE